MLRGNAPLTAVELVSAIIESFPSHATDVDQTAFLRRSLERLGTSHGYKVVSPHTDLQPGEAAFVLHWWEPGTGTILAAGCAWGNAGEVAAALTTLMTVKAPMKLLIFRSREAGAERPDILLRTDIHAVLTASGAALLDFRQHLQGELYLLLEHVQNEPRFRSYEFRVPADGKLALAIPAAAQMFRALEPCAAVAGR